MLDVRLITQICCVFACLTCVFSEGYYLIVAPKVLRPTLNYHVSVSVHNVTRPVGMTITIGGLTDSGVPIMMSQQALLESDKSQVVNFQVGDWGTGKYTMRVVGSGGLQFSNETELYYEHKSYLVFVQTDKAIYKPGQPVKIRVIVVGPSLKPASTGNLDMFITDGKGNRIKQWKRVFLTRGVFSTEMPLSEEPVLGDWNITVTILDQVYTKSFTVAEYVLPNFEVSVHVPPYATFNSSDMVATIEAKYTYGKPVKGKVVVMVTPLVRSPQIRTYYTDPLRKIAEIDGKVEIPFNLQHDLNLKDDYHRMIRFEAIVTEAQTERRENSTAVIGMFKYPEKIELIKMSETFKPGLKFSAFLKISFQDDIPVDDDANPLVLKYGYSHDESLYERREFKIPRNGTIPFDIFPPLADNINQLVMIAQYKDIQQPFVPIHRAESPSNTYIQAVLLTEKPRVGEEVIIQVNSTVPLKTFNVVVMGRGDIVFSDSVAANDKRTIAVKFAPTNPMAPRIRFIVYYTTPQGEVVADGLSFEVEGVFQNYVNVDSSRAETQPGQTVNLQISTNRNSLVGLLAVDQSVLLLKTGNDVTQGDILKQLDKFDPGKQPYSDEDLFYSAVWFPGSSTAAEVFKNSGVIVLSNSLIYEDFDFFETRGGELRPGFEKGRPVGDYFIPKESEIGFRDPLDGTIIPTVRQHFPETWMWSEVTAGGDGKAVITREAPDTITSWVITAFSLDSVTGLAVTNSPSRVTVFRPFFISLNLPYAVIRGEAISVQVVVFNYMKRPVSATVTLENTNQFDFVSIEDEANEVQATSLKSKKVIVESGDPTSVYFMIVPKELGYIDIKVTARADIAGDAVLKKLLVKPQGVPQNFNKAFLVDLRMPSLFNANATIEIPKHAVSGSERIQVSAIADVMGPTINNFDKLLQMPFGCGEQNMILFVPNIVALEYLTSSDQLTDSLRAKAITNMEKGYQRELTYKRDDGSFSAFGNQDESGSTWLTAFVCKSFALAKPYITIDEQVINQSLTWLSEQQLENGSFPEVGTVSNKEIQGGAAKGTALTAFVLIAFLENKGTTQFTPFMIKALHLLEQEVENLHQVYSLAITTYALHLANSPSKDGAFRRLQGTATTQGDLKFWRRVSDVATPATLNQVKPVDIETTAYALLTYVLRGDLSGAMQIMKWLVTQRNEEGGFLSTQDTVVAVQALAKLAMNIVDPKVSINVAFSYNDQKKTFNLNRNNALILQKEQLPGDVKLVNISATGNGFALVQVSYSYNIFVSKEFPSFQVNPFVDRSSTKNRMQLNACVAYGEKGGVSNMAVMEVTLPSGFIIDRNSLSALHGVDRVKRVDINDQDTGVTIYFDKLDNNLVCPTIKAYRVFRVAKQKQTAVNVYDYYDQAKGARYFFQAPQVSLCDICDGEECNSRKCQEEAEEKQQAAIQEEESSASGALISVILIVLACFISTFVH